MRVVVGGKATLLAAFAEWEDIKEVGGWKRCGFWAKSVLVSW